MKKSCDVLLNYFHIGFIDKKVDDIIGCSTYFFFPLYGRFGWSLVHAWGCKCFGSGGFFINLSIPDIFGI